MGFNSGAGFTSVSTGGSPSPPSPSSSQLLSINYYTVQATGSATSPWPVDGLSSYTLVPPVVGNTVDLSVQGFGPLELGVDFSVTVDTSVPAIPTITAITLLAGRLFNTGEIYRLLSWIVT